MADLKVTKEKDIFGENCLGLLFGTIGDMGIKKSSKWGELRHVN